MEFFFPIPKDMIRNEMCTTFYPFIYVLTESRPTEVKSYPIKALIFSHVASIRSWIYVAEYFPSQSYQNCDQSDKSIVRKDRSL